MNVATDAIVIETVRAAGIGIVIASDEKEAENAPAKMLMETKT